MCVCVVVFLGGGAGWVCSGRIKFCAIQEVKQFENKWEAISCNHREEVAGLKKKYW